MGIITIIHTVKKIHEEDIALVKVGNFYYVYDKDACIISYLFGYKIKSIENTITCGFPINSFKRVIATLENKKINYIVLDRRNNYELDEKSNNKNLNQYGKYYKKAKKFVNDKMKIDNIYDYLIKNLETKDLKETILRVEKIVYEGRKI